MSSKFKRRGHYKTNMYGTRFWVRPHDVTREYSVEVRNGESYINGQHKLLPIRCPYCYNSVFYSYLGGDTRLLFNGTHHPVTRHDCRKNNERSIQRDGPLKEPKKFMSKQEIDAQNNKNKDHIEIKVLKALGGGWAFKKRENLSATTIKNLVEAILELQLKIKENPSARMGLNLPKKKIEKSKSISSKDTNYEKQLKTSAEEKQNQITELQKQLLEVLGDKIIRVGTSAQSKDNLMVPKLKSLRTKFSTTTGTKRKIKKTAKPRTVASEKKLKEFSEKIKSEDDLIKRKHYEIKKLEIQKKGLVDKHGLEAKGISNEIKRLEEERVELIKQRSLSFAKNDSLTEKQKNKNASRTTTYTGRKQKSRVNLIKLKKEINDQRNKIKLLEAQKKTAQRFDTRKIYNAKLRKENAQLLRLQKRLEWQT